MFRSDPRIGGGSLRISSAAVLTLLAVGFLAVVVGLPVVLVFVEAFRKGAGVYWASLTDQYALAAIRLTLFVAAIAVPLNVLFGLAASWCRIA